MIVQFTTNVLLFGNLRSGSVAHLSKSRRDVLDKSALYHGHKRALVPAERGLSMYPWLQLGPTDRTHGVSSALILLAVSSPTMKQNGSSVLQRRFCVLHLVPWLVVGFVGATLVVYMVVGFGFLWV